MCTNQYSSLLGFATKYYLLPCDTKDQIIRICLDIEKKNEQEVINKDHT